MCIQLNITKDNNNDSIEYAIIKLRDDKGILRSCCYPVKKGFSTMT
jgi:hypothetical protein